MIIKLPLSTDPAQTFTTQLGDRKLKFDVKWNDRSSVWAMDLYDATTLELLLAGVPFVLGQELLEPYNLGLGRMIVSDDTNGGAEAALSTLGSTVNVYWISDDEVLP